MRRGPSIALAAPAGVLAAGLALSLVLGAFGRNPIWPDQHLNVSEAAAARDEAEVLRLIAHGEDPNIPRDVRPGLLVDRVVRVTPLEAAVLSQRGVMVERLLANGAVIDDTAWNRLRCLAEGNEAAHVLDRHRPAGAVMRCDGVTVR